MKKILAILAISLIACNSKKEPCTRVGNTEIDSAIAVQKRLCELSTDAKDKRFDSVLNRVKILTDSIKQENDSLKRKVFLYKYTIARVRYRLNIVDNNPSQLKFLKGWIRRIIDVE